MEAWEPGVVDDGKGVYAVENGGAAVAQVVWEMVLSVVDEAGATYNGKDLYKDTQSKGET